MTKFGARHELTWGQFRRGNPRWAGEILFLEAERLAAQLDKEIGIRYSQHEINWNDVTFELRLRYTVLDDEAGGTATSVGRS